MRGGNRACDALADLDFGAGDLRRRGPRAADELRHLHAVSRAVQADVARLHGRHVEQDVEVEIQEVFAYSHDEAFDYEVHDTLVDLEPVVRDAVVLSLPFQPVCQDECAGLCPQCGVRLLDHPGHEHEAPVDPRWSALGGLAGLTKDDVTGAESGAEEEKR